MEVREIPQHLPETVSLLDKLRMAIFHGELTPGQRLVETARQMGKDAYLIDDHSELDARWRQGRKSVFVTAGASAPERLVEALLERLKREFGGVIETRTLVKEDVAFAPPKSLRSLTVVA